MKKLSIRAGLLASSLCILHLAFAEGTNTLAEATTNSPAVAAPLSLPTTSLTDVGPSLLRVFGALALVLAIFLGGVWLFRNWQRLVIQRGRTPRLNTLQNRSLG